MWIQIDTYILREEDIQEIYLSRDDKSVVIVSTKHSKHAIFCQTTKGVETCLKKIYDQLSKKSEIVTLEEKVADLQQQLLYLPAVSENFKNAKADFEENSDKKPV